VTDCEDKNFVLLAVSKSSPLGVLLHCTTSTETCTMAQLPTTRNIKILRKWTLIEIAMVDMAHMMAGSIRRVISDKAIFIRRRSRPQPGSGTHYDVGSSCELSKPGVFCQSRVWQILNSRFLLMVQCAWLVRYNMKLDCVANFITMTAQLSNSSGLDCGWAGCAARIGQP